MTSNWSRIRSSVRRFACQTLIFCALWLAGFPEQSAFPDPGDDGTGRAAGTRPIADGGTGADEDQVIVKREAVRLIDPRTFKASMQLRALRTTDLTAPVDGTIRSIVGKPQQRVTAQAEVMRLDDARANLAVKRAKAQYQAAQIEKKLVQAKGDADLTALSESKLEAAQADLEMAQLDADRLMIRSPIQGEIERVYVSEGQFVRAGDRLATVYDPTKYFVEVPADRSAAAPGRFLDIRIEDQPVKAKVEHVLPLHAQFDPLRELIASPVSAVVIVENTDGKLASGQTVYTDLIPLVPMTLVPTVAISNSPDGNRKLQVLRDNVVRDLTVRLMGKVGTESIYVAGRFSEGDEVVVSTTKPLADGTTLRSLAQGGSRGPAAAKSAGGTAQGARPGPGF